MANCFSMSSPPSALVRRQLVDRRGQHAPQLVPECRILGAVLPPHRRISHCSSIHTRRYASSYNATNSSSSRGDVSDELASLRPQPARRVRGGHAGRQRDAGGKTARHESTSPEPCPEPLSGSGEGSVVHPPPDRGGADTSRRAAGAAAAPCPRGNAT